MSTFEYGEYSAFNSWTGIIGIFVTLNLSWGVYTQGLIKFEDQRNIFSASLQGLTLILCVIWTFVYLLFAGFWNSLLKLATLQMLAMLATIWLSAVFGFWASEQRVMYRYRQLVIVTLAVSVLNPLVGILFVTHASDKVTVRILASLLVSFAGYTWMFFAQLKRGRTFFSKRFWSYAVRFNLPLIPHYLSQTVLNNSDRIMIRDLAGASEAGIYSIAYSISMLMLLFNSAIGQTIDPWVYQKIKDRKTEDIKSVAYPALIFVAAANLALIAFAPEAVRFFAPPEYYEAIWVIPPVAMSVIFIFSYDLFAKFEFYFEKTNYIMLASVIGAVLNVVLNYIFIRLYGYQAAAYTTLFCYMLYALAHFWFMRKVCNQFLDGIHPYSYKVLLLIYGSFLACGTILLFSYRVTALRYGLIVLAVICMIMFRKPIVAYMKQFVDLRKTGIQNGENI